MIGTGKRLYDAQVYAKERYEDDEIRRSLLRLSSGELHYGDRTPDLAGVLLAAYQPGKELHRKAGHHVGALPRPSFRDSTGP